MHALMTDVGWTFAGFVGAVALFCVLMVTGIYLAAHSYEEHRRHRSRRHLPWHHA